MQLYHIAINNLRRRKGKVVFVLLGLIIGIATMVSVYSVVEAMKAEMTRQVAEFGANVVITPAAAELTFSYGGITLPEVMFDMERLSMGHVAAIEDVPSRNMIRAVAPKLLGAAVTESGYNLLVAGVDLQHEFMVKPWLRLRDGQGTTAEAREASGGGDFGSGKQMGFEPLDLTREELAQLALSDDDVILGATLAEALGVAEGGSLHLSDGKYHIFAVLTESGSVEDEQVIMNLRAAQALLKRPDEITLIELSVDYSLGSEDELLGQLTQALPRAEIASLRQEAMRSDGMLTRLARFGMAVSLIIMLVGMLVAGLTMSSAVHERTLEIAVFRAIGFRKSHVAKIILLEGMLLSLPGGILGFVAGIFIARYAGPFFAGMNITVPWRLGLLALAVLLAVIVGFLASILPARQASNLDPAEALRFI